MTTLGDAALRQLALNILAHGGAASDTVALAAAARRAYDDLAHVSTPLIGQVGIDALTARAVHIARREYSWLFDSREQEPTDELFARVIVSLERQQPAVAAQGAAAVFATFAGLLVSFIGEPLTAGLLRKAWPTAFSSSHTEGK
jgi:hypothetical protein